MTKFDIACDYVLENEKGLANIPGDDGGLTNWGISTKFIESLKDTDEIPAIGFNVELTLDNIRIHGSPKKFFKRHGMPEGFLDVKGYIETLTIEQAKWIYQKYFWLPIYYQIEDQDICNFIFDMTVQHGHKKAAELTQRAVNAHKGERILKIDGVFGDGTLNYCNNQLCLYTHLIAVRESLFRCIVAMHPEKANCLNGWLNRCYR